MGNGHDPIKLGLGDFKSPALNLVALQERSEEALGASQTDERYANLAHACRALVVELRHHQLTAERMEASKRGSKEQAHARAVLQGQSTGYRFAADKLASLLGDDFPT